VPATRRRDIDAWCQSFRGDANAARYFRDLHATNPVSARRLADAIVAMPEAGGEFLGFRLEAELGRGALGRVFLARQGDLADRRVAAKVTPDIGGGSLRWRMRSTRIVPVYSVHRTGTLQAICCPPAAPPWLMSARLAHRPRYRGPARIAQQRVARPIRPDRCRWDGAGSRNRSAAVTLRSSSRSYAEAVLWPGAARQGPGMPQARHPHRPQAGQRPADRRGRRYLDFNLSEDVKLLAPQPPRPSAERCRAAGTARSVLREAARRRG
jgi:hypothetical protein